MSVNIMEVAQMMQDREAIQRDMNEAIQLVKNNLTEKYMSKLQSAVTAQHLKTVETPPKEVQLMQAMKRFMPEHRHAHVDQIINTLLFINTTKNIQAELAPQMQAQAQAQQKSTRAGTNETAASSPLNGSIHADGIYDVDYACLEHNQSALNTLPPALLALCMLFRGHP